MVTTIVNLTPHEVSIVRKNTEKNTMEVIMVVPPSGAIARAEVTYTPDGEALPGIAAYRAKYGAVVGLPAPDPEKIYLVAGLVAAHPSVAGRADVFAPGDLVRDGAGQPVGCLGLKRA